MPALVQSEAAIISPILERVRGQEIRAGLNLYCSDTRTIAQEAAGGGRGGPGDVNTGTNLIIQVVME